MTQAMAQGAAKPVYAVDSLEDHPAAKGLGERIWDAYADMRLSTRELIASNPSEARLLLFALVSDIAFFLARSISMVVKAPPEVAAVMPERIGLWLIGSLFLRTALFYLIAAAACVIARAFGGRASWRETRIGVFWAALVSAPIEIVGAAISVGVAGLGWSAGAMGGVSLWLMETPYFIGPIAFGYFLAAGLAEAHGFRFVYRVLAVMAVLIFAAILAWAYISSGAYAR